MVEFDLMYGKGISKSGELIDLGAKADVVENLVHGTHIREKKLAKVERMLNFI